ncbi:MAG: hypothetical protein HS113_13290 [Verrucomicrobiales bacterium]|nr:hypothetical protein [Verrucomicrobiales bacterium]
MKVVASGDGRLMWSASEGGNVVETNTLVDFSDCLWQTNVVVQTSRDLLGMVWKIGETAPHQRPAGRVRAQPDRRRR